MAQRRMVSLKVIDTDIFLDMPLSTQALYFHLITRADDDGFIANHNKIMRMIGSNNDDMKILLSKEFIIPFESGVCVIKHWKIHNLIRSDRYNETIYKIEKDSLKEDHNKVYIPNVIPEDIPHVTQMDTQSSLGQGSSGKINKGKINNSDLKQGKTPTAELTAQSKKIIHPLYNPIKDSFLSKNGNQFTDYKKEGMAIKGLIKKAETRFPEDPGSFIKSAIEIFYDLTQSNDKYWNSQPFIPSRLNSSGIFDSVLKQMQEDVFIPNEPDYDNMEAGEIIF